jgi:hypothetical protein
MLVFEGGETEFENVRKKGLVPHINKFPRITKEVSK